MCTYWNVNYSENCGYNCHVVTEKNILTNHLVGKKNSISKISLYN